MERRGGLPPITFPLPILFSQKFPLKEPLRPQASRGSSRWGRERGVSPPPKNVPTIFFRTNFPLRETATAGRKGMLEWVFLPKKIFSSKKFSKNFPRRAQCGRRPPGVARG